MKKRPSGFPVHVGAGSTVPAEAGLLGDPGQDASWQPAIFLKVNNETTAVSHLKKLWKPPGGQGAGGAPGWAQFFCRGLPSLTALHTLVAVLSTSAQCSKSSLGRRCGMGVSLPQQGSDISCLELLAWLGSCPQSGFLLQASVSPSANCISHSGAQLPHGLPKRGHRGQTVPALFPHWGLL